MNATVSCTACGAPIQAAIAAYSAGGDLVCDACHQKSSQADNRVTNARYRLYTATFLVVFSIVMGFDPFRLLTGTAFVLALQVQRLPKQLEDEDVEAAGTAKRLRLWALALLVVCGGVIALTVATLLWALLLVSMSG
ncbi:MAG: hypothetical protein OXU20_18760 [Myxococcales bacterium]|nr:hypothetical protein [Myxococcales bacterium]